MPAMKTRTLGFLFAFLLVTTLRAENANETYFAKFHPAKAPKPHGLVLKKNDRLAICGDSITEQKMYSRIVETYLTVCTPELNITSRQFGWSGERAEGFLRRMTNDVLRFKPTIATTCYGMNDHQYRSYTQEIGAYYRTNSLGVVRGFKGNGTRVIQGSPGCIGVRPFWSQDKAATADDLNISLCQLRNIDIDIAKSEKVDFADVFWPMLVASRMGKDKYGDKYEVPGKDGVHPGWSGHLIMAYAFLKSMGVDGDIGTFTVDLKSGKGKVTKGHQLISAENGSWRIQSSRYPFCATGDINSDNSVRSGMTLVPFNQELNRLMLVAKNARAPRYKVTWGDESHTYTAAQLRNGINLAREFEKNPFLAAFTKVDEAVAAKQAYETKQIKQLLHSAEATKDMEKVVADSEKERTPLADAIRTAFVPVTHELKIVAE